MAEGHRERLRDRVIKQGIDSLLEHEILELFLYSYIPRKDTNPIAHELIKTFGSLAKVIDASPEELMCVKNMTKNASVGISSMKSIVKRYSAEKSISTERLELVEEVANKVQALSKFNNTETLYIICLNVQFKLIDLYEVKSKSPDTINFSMDDVYQRIIIHKPRYLIISHNHPSGSVKPSTVDIKMTREIIKALDYFSTELIDHIIVTDKEYFSFKQQGLIKKIIDEHMKALAVADKYSTLGDNYDDKN